MTRLFLSSVRSGLAHLPAQIVEDLRRGGFDVSNMEIFGARPELPLEACLAELRKCDAVILIVGPRYGTLTPAGEVSYTHEEFREACRRGIPVLAFVLPPNEGIPDDERNRLREFETEVGSAVVFQRTSSADLRTDIATTLLQRLQAGDIGRRFTFFQTYHKFFERQLESRLLFNHLLPLVGQQEALERLTRFLRSDEAALVLSAPGGVGKSRLLLEIARSAESEPQLPRVRFVVPDAGWTPDDIASLPAGRVVVTIDDAHRRYDLGELLQACLTQNTEARFLVSCRPPSCRHLPAW